MLIPFIKLTKVKVNRDINTKNNPFGIYFLKSRLSLEEFKIDLLLEIEMDGFLVLTFWTSIQVYIGLL